MTTECTDTLGADESRCYYSGGELYDSGAADEADTMSSDDDTESEDDYTSYTSASDPEESHNPENVYPADLIQCSNQHEDSQCSFSGSSGDDDDQCSRSRRQQRKSNNPVKSPDPQDPKFRGVTVQFRTRLHQDRVQLILTAYFSCRKPIRRRWRERQTSSAPTESLTVPSFNRSSKPGHTCNSNTASKQCASCCTRKTPLWRDAEDGTPLCNACGIRYKKYRVRCGHCWFVPKKESKTNPVCTNCGQLLRFPFFRYKPSII